jgi:polyisoprenoid-binding protein YceI
MSTATLQITPASYALDPIHSSIGFTVKHMVSRFRGTFGDYDASLTVDEGGQLELTGDVRVASVDVKDPNLAGHLLSPDFFDAERYPEINFKSTGSRIEDSGELVVDGELTIKGHTHVVEARGTLTHIEADPSGNERIGVDLETIVDRTAYGLDWNAPLPKGGFALGNDVKLTVELEVTRAP